MIHSPRVNSQNIVSNLLISKQYTLDPLVSRASYPRLTSYDKFRIKISRWKLNQVTLNIITIFDKIFYNDTPLNLYLFLYIYTINNHNKLPLPQLY